MSLSDLISEPPKFDNKSLREMIMVNQGYANQMGDAGDRYTQDFESFSRSLMRKGAAAWDKNRDYIKGISQAANRTGDAAHRDSTRYNAAYDRLNKGYEKIGQEISNARQGLSSAFDKYTEAGERFFDPANRAEKVEGASSRAISDVGQAFDAERRNQQSRLESYGIDPSMTRSRALDKDVSIAEAASKAQAGTQMGFQAGQQFDERAERELARQSQIQQFISQMEQGYLGMEEGVARNRVLMNEGLADRAMQGYGQQGQLNSAAVGATAANQDMLEGTGRTSAAIRQGVLPYYQGAAGVHNANMGNFLNGQKGQLEEYNSSFDLGQFIVETAGNAIGEKVGGMSEGGTVPHPSEVGIPPAPSPPNDRRGTDNMPMTLTPGEFVVPEEAVRWKGEEYFHKQVAKAQEDSAKSKQQRGIPA